MHIDRKALDALPLLERRLLEVAAVALVDLTRGHTIGALRRLGLKDPQGRAWTTRRVAGPLEALCERGLLDDYGRCPQPLADDVTRLLLADGSWDRVADAVAAACPLQASGDREHGLTWKSRGRDHFAAWIRMALFRDQWDRALQLRADALAWHGSDSAPLGRAVLRPPHPGWLETIPGEVARPLLAELLREAARELAPFEHLVAPARARLGEADDPELRQRLAELLLLATGDVGGLLPDPVSGEQASLRAFAVALGGRYREAAIGWEDALRLHRRRTRKRRAPLDDAWSAFFPLALIAAGDLDRAIEVAEAAGRGDGPASDVAFVTTEAARVRRGEDVYWLGGSPPEDAPALLVWLLATRAADQPLSEPRRELATTLARRVMDDGYRWLARELLAACGVAAPELEDVPGRPWAEALAPIPKWRRRLDALLARAPASSEQPAQQEPATAASERLAWFLEKDYGAWGIQPKLQKRGKRGWSGGRNVALKRLEGSSEMPELLSPHDRRVLAHLYHDVYYSQGYPKDTWGFRRPQALEALEGHPLLFDGDTGSPATITRVEPAVRLERGPWGARLRMEPPPSGGAGFRLIRAGDGRFELAVYGEDRHELARALREELVVPPGHDEEVTAAVALLASAFPVTAEGDQPGAEAREVPADPTVGVLLAREGDGLAVQLRVRPWPGGPALRPGAGGDRVRQVRDGEPVVALRDLEAERAAVAELTVSCPTLGLAGDLLGGDGLLAEPEDALALLAELAEAMPPERVEWPAGRRQAVVRAAALRLSLAQVGRWFVASGTLEVDEELVLDLRELLRLRERRRGPFLPLDEGRWLGLDPATARHLERLAALAHEEGDGGLRFHRLAAPGLIDAVDGLQVGVDEAWRRAVNAMDPAAPIEVPGSLRAELRPYQEDGFRWLARLASWGAGACLADEMGLGKTVQVLALLLRRAERGPALVVAPRSVVHGWLREAARFAPALRARELGSGDREALLGSLGPRDVLLCSYGLLVSEAEPLAAVGWSTAVLDEAQAIKNPDTARARAAFALRAETRVALTGTPVENRALDLWSLFRFVAPGLLGGQKAFKTRFAAPIERGEAGARAALRARLRPFILRRTRAAVAPELPPRTERLLPVALARGEAALYEAIRQEALEALAGGGDVMTALAWLTKLRLACCHPRLAGGEGMSSSKTEALLELVEELRDGGHRALVFSQFVRHLELVREQLDQRSIRYRYLDGSTPAAARQEAVDAFEAGDGDLFLISLRAGGTGLNLVSADNVVHLDPWWNPAVEDQASDRVHRIGQRRPVTIHRLVAEGTIEEDIVALHHRKRTLADSLLAGGDAAARLSVEELVALIREGSRPGPGD